VCAITGLENSGVEWVSVTVSDTLSQIPDQGFLGFAVVGSGRHPAEMKPPEEPGVTGLSESASHSQRFFLHNSNVFESCGWLSLTVTF
jgi:hypothetical protein